jgi:hypothetical protein
MRIALAIIILSICSLGIISLFWHQEYQYSLPTPVPENYTPVAKGQFVNLADAGLQKKGPLFLHFYNPDCPCSRFNATHIKSLIRNYSDSVELIIIVPDQYSLSKAKKEFGENLDYFVDTKQALAESVGVYSTPQAAIINRNNELFFRGNYNLSRYCTSKETNFAELSLIALLNNRPPPVFSMLATQAYGCELTQEKQLVELSLF